MLKQKLMTTFLFVLVAPTLQAQTTRAECSKPTIAVYPAKYHHGKQNTGLELVDNQGVTLEIERASLSKEQKVVSLTLSPSSAKQLAKLSRKHRHLAIDFNQGFIVRPGPDGLAAQATRLPYTTAALAMIAF